MAHLVRLLCLLLAGIALSGCAERRYGIPLVKLRYETTIERRVTLSTLRRAWADRPRKICPEGNLYERALLNRAAFFGRRIKRTETYEAACNFWMDCLREHIVSYEDEAHKFLN
jgi:hypothetical protein